MLDDSPVGRPLISGNTNTSKWISTIRRYIAIYGFSWHDFGVDTIGTTSSDFFNTPLRCAPIMPSLTAIPGMPI